jgi:hypothetical protein
MTPFSAFLFDSGLGSSEYTTSFLTAFLPYSLSLLSSIILNIFSVLDTKRMHWNIFLPN